MILEIDSFTDAFGIDKSSVLEAYQEFLENHEIIAHYSVRNDFLEQYLRDNKFKISKDRIVDYLVEYKLTTIIFELVSRNKLHLIDCKKITPQTYDRVLYITDLFWDDETLEQTLGKMAKCCVKKSSKIIVQRLNAFSTKEKLKLLFSPKIRGMGIHQFLNWEKSREVFA